MVGLSCCPTATATGGRSGEEDVPCLGARIDLNRPLKCPSCLKGRQLCEFRRNPATDSDLKPATVPI
jgi:hypothetical protein